MIRQFFYVAAKIVSRFIEQPIRVLIVSFVLVFAGLVLDGSLIRLWRLQRDSAELQKRMQILQVETNDLDKKITQAKDPNFIELQARERFDLASEGDLIFVFSEGQ